MGISCSRDYHKANSEKRTTKQFGTVRQLTQTKLITLKRKKNEKLELPRKIGNVLSLMMTVFRINFKSSIIKQYSPFHTAT